MNIAVFWDVAPCRQQKFTDVSEVHHPGFLTMKVVTKSSVNFYQTTRRNIPEDNHLHTRRRENLKSQFYCILCPKSNQFKVVSGDDLRPSYQLTSPAWVDVSLPSKYLNG
jgi:hypothetical protein